MKPIELKRGDACPSCRGELKPAYVPTEEEFARAFDRENPISLPPGADTANKTQRSELGELHRCTTCGYQARFPADKGGRDTRGGAQPAGGRASGGASTSGSGGQASGSSGYEPAETAAAAGGSGGDVNDPEFLEWKRQRDEARSHFQG
jgi:hypothetical protein